MKTYIRRREKNKELVVLYGGWGTDENAFVPLCNDDFDFILFYNYSANEALVLPETKAYSRIILIGWSMGVWAAQYISAKTGINPDLKIAVNGTPLPADDNYDISLQALEGTLNNLSEKNIMKFYLRMFGGKKILLENQDRIPQRSVKSLQDELRWLYNRMMEISEEKFKWDFAVISENDRVFPVRAQKLYWANQKETKTILLPMSHYIFHNWPNFADFIRYIETWEYSSRKKQNKKRSL
ncbi:MAG: pimeloyl-ACP methyl esterase BioG family protein [Bacteroidales bacterium]